MYKKLLIPILGISLLALPLSACSGSDTDSEQVESGSTDNSEEESEPTDSSEEESEATDSSEEENESADSSEEETEELSEEEFAANVEYTVYETGMQVILQFENNNDSAAFIQKVNISFLNENGDLIDSETMEGLFVSEHSVNYGEVTYYDEYSSIEVEPYIYEDDEGFDSNDVFTTSVSEDDEVSDMYITLTNESDHDASAMITVLFYKDDSLFYVSPDVGETMLSAGDSEEVMVELPHDENFNFLGYDSYEILTMGYSY